MVSNDGEVYSAFGNARQNGLTPFRFDSATVAAAGSGRLYPRSRHRRDRRARALRRSSARTRRIEVAYEPGVATFTKRRGDLAITYVVFVPPDFPGDMRLLTLRNLGREPLRLRVAPFFDIALDESRQRKRRQDSQDETVGRRLLFENPRNDFQRGVAFAATSLANPRPKPCAPASSAGRGATSIRRRWSRPARPTARSATTAAGSPRSPRDSTLAPGAETKIAIVIGQAPSRADALASPARPRSPGPRRNSRRRARVGRERLGEVEVTHQPPRLRPPRQHLAALSALRLASVRPRRPQPARRRVRLSRSVAGRAAADLASSRASRARRSCCTPASSSSKATC